MLDIKICRKSFFIGPLDNKSSENPIKKKKVVPIIKFIYSTFKKLIPFRKYEIVEEIKKLVSKVIPPTLTRLYLWCFLLSKESLKLYLSPKIRTKGFK